MSPSEPRSTRVKPNAKRKSWAVLLLGLPRDLILQAIRWLWHKLTAPSRMLSWFRALFCVLLGLLLGWFLRSQDRCSNISWVQWRVPLDMHIDSSGRCVPRPRPLPVDVCPDLPGMQTEVPLGMRIVPQSCVAASRERTPDPPPPPTPVDRCANIAGLQEEVPAGLLSDKAGQCACPPPTPAAPCPQCKCETVDVCKNLDGAQAKVPAGMLANDQGQCAKPPAVPIPPPCNDDTVALMQQQRLRDECLQSAERRQACSDYCRKPDNQAKCLKRYGKLPRF